MRTRGPGSRQRIRERVTKFTLPPVPSIYPTHQEPAEARHGLCRQIQGVVGGHTRPC